MIAPPLPPTALKPAAAPTPAGGALVSDLLASVVVFLVALPLCVAISQACGLPAEAGVITGIVGGILVGVLAGSPLQVSGPAAGLIVLVQDIVTAPDGLVRLGWVVLLAGLMQAVAGVLRLGQWFRAVSPAVVLGMLAGIGLIILAKQFHALFDTPAPASIFDSLKAIPATLRAAIDHGSLTGPAAAGAVGGTTVLVMVLWKAVAPKPVSLIPAAVVAVLAAVLVVELTGWPVAKVRVSDLQDGVRLLNPAVDWGLLRDGHLWASAVTIALIASAETLLCAAAVDAKHTGPRTRYNRELIAQGVGNAACGVLGVLPMTGVIVRSAANVEAGAKTQLSAVLHGVWLLLFVMFLPFLLGRVPLAALAGVLVYTGWKLLELPEAGKLFRLSKGAFLVYLVTAAGVVLTDLLTGVLIGVGLTAARLLWLFSNMTVTVERDPAHRRVHLHLDGAGTFLCLPQLAAALEGVPPGQHLHVHIERLRFVDHAILEALDKFQTQYATTGGKVYLDFDHLKARFHTPKGSHAQLPPAGPTG
jgi:MFS superfamily sulfate permease-like transporter